MGQRSGATPLPAAVTSVAAFLVGDWRVDPALNRMERGSNTVQIEPRIMHVLVCLANRPGDVVSRAELLKTVWGRADVADEALTITISELRRIFSDATRSPQYITTIRKGGYRLVAPVSIDTTAARPATRRSWRLPALVTIVALAAMVPTYVITRIRETGLSAPPASLALRGVPLTSYRGHEMHPAVAPDGKRVAFAWDGASGDNLDIYIRQINTDSPLRLTDHPASDYKPAWSPDGTSIVFARSDSVHAIYVVPAIGGAERRLVNVNSYVDGLNWSPDGEWIAFAALLEGETWHQVHMLSLSTQEIRSLTAETEQFSCSVEPVFSPDGSTIAFIRSSPAFQQDIYLLTLAGGEPRRLTYSQRQVYGLDWTMDGRKIVFGAAPSADFRLWQVSIADGAVTWFPTRARKVLRPSIARDRDLLVYQDLVSDQDIWRVRLPADDDPRRGAESTGAICLVSSTYPDYGAHYSPDGTRIAFVSQRSGERQIWTCDAAGGQLQQLTWFNESYVMPPRWSPGGDRIVFSMIAENGAASIHVLTVAEAFSRRVSDNDGIRHQLLADWSRDGRWLYYSTNCEPDWQIWRMRPDGSEAQPVLESGHDMVHETADGRILFLKNGAGGVWEQSAADGGVRRIVDADTMVEWIDWAAIDGWVYFTHHTGQGVALSKLELATGQSERVCSLTRYGGHGLSIAPGGEAILFDGSEAYECDLILVDDFRSRGLRP